MASGLSHAVLALWLSLICGLFGCQPSVAPADHVAELEGEPIPYAAFEEFLRSNSVVRPGVLGSDVLSALLDQFLDERLLCRLAAERLDLSELPDVRTAAEALIGVSEDPDPQVVARTYRENRARFDLPERIHLRQVLFTDPSVAERVRERWATGAGYGEILGEIVDSPGAHPGEEGVFARDELPAAFAELLFELDEGAVSEVLAADYGLHVFQVVRHWPAGIAPLSEVAEGIRDELVAQQRQQALARLVEEARERYNVRVFERNVPFNYRGEFDSNLQDAKN